MNARHTTHVAPAHTATELASTRVLFHEYADSLGFSLCFQGFDEELATLPGKYAPPHGQILLATVKGDLAGCVAVRPLASERGERVCEMKRLYVRPEFRHHGTGRVLAVALIEVAREMGYAAMRLDTLSTMTAAISLYESLGFRRISAYYDNPIQTATYFELDLCLSAKP
jgi:putative acetyltransferase